MPHYAPTEYLLKQESGATSMAGLAWLLGAMVGTLLDPVLIAGSAAIGWFSRTRTSALVGGAAFGLALRLLLSLIGTQQFQGQPALRSSPLDLGLGVIASMLGGILIAFLVQYIRMRMRGAKMQNPPAP